MFVLKKKKKKYLDGATPCFMKQSSDCNPIEYTISDSLREKVCSKQREKFSENEFKQKITEEWKNSTSEKIRK